MPDQTPLDASATPPELADLAAATPLESAPDTLSALGVERPKRKAPSFELRLAVAADGIDGGWSLEIVKEAKVAALHSGNHTGGDRAALVGIALDSALARLPLACALVVAGGDEDRAALAAALAGEAGAKRLGERSCASATLAVADQARLQAKASEEAGHGRRQREWIASLPEGKVPDDFFAPAT